MNGDPPAKASLRQLLHELLCDQAAALTVLSISLAFPGWFMVKAGLRYDEDLLTTIGALALAAPLVFAWILYDPDSPAGACTSAAGGSGRGEIARMTDAEFDRLLDEVERQARMAPVPPSPTPVGLSGGDDEFAQIVREALDELPQFVQDELRGGNLAVRVSDRGWERHAYGLYCGATVAGDDFNHLITIFRDTLTAQFGHDPDELRRQVAITVRHEVAHHFGADERRVEELGL